MATLRALRPTHLLGWALFVLVLATVPALGADGPSIHLVPAAKQQPAAIEVQGLDRAVLARLKENPPSDWASLFAVRVGQAMTPMLGTYRVTKDALRFEPRFPLRPGLEYRVTFGASKMGDGIPAKPVTAIVAIPKPPIVATAVVEHVYPSSAVLPENQLKFYIHFSRPMSRGEAYQRIRLLKEDGKAVERPFLELDEELWTPDGKRFTIFFHPGRIKSGLGPREEFGPILEEGKRYSLVIDAGWPDEDGNPLKAEFRKSFKAGKVDNEQPDPNRWKLHAPKAGTIEALRLQFAKPLDHALLQRMLKVIGGSERGVDGEIRVSQEEMVWSFIPAKPWVAGKYQIQVNLALEDLAGNSIASPFEVDVFRPVQRELKTRTLEMPFEVR